MCLPDGKEKQAAIRKLALNLDQLSSSPPRSIDSLLGVEGNAAIAYFGCWQTIALSWKGTGRKPIPDDWYRVSFRSSVARAKLKNRNASHPVNAMLNYAYAILESNVRIQILAEGYDPTISFLHSSRLGRESLVFDFMEPLRPIVDRAILGFIKTHVFHPADFPIRPDGVTRLHPEMARRVASLDFPLGPNTATGNLRHVCAIGN